MKIGKKLTFLGLAVLGTVSLASCDLAKYISDFANGVTGERSLEYTQVIPSSNQPSATVPSQITSTTTNKYNPTTTTTTNKYNPIQSSTVKEYNVNFVSIVDGVQKSLFKDSYYTKSGYVSCPGYLEFNNYEFDGYYESINPYLVFDFNKPISSNKIIYAVFHERESSYYYKKIKEPSNIFFQDKYFGFNPIQGSAFDSNSPQLKVDNYKYMFYDSRGLVINTTNAYVDLGSYYKYQKGYCEITFDVTFDNVKDETFFSIVGESSRFPSGGDIFSFSIKSNTLYYKIDGGGNMSVDYKNNKIYTNSTYSFQISIDFYSGKVFVSDGRGEYIISNGIVISGIYGLKFLSKSNPMALNNIAVNFDVY